MPLRPPRTFAVGDIHGCRRALDAVLAVIHPAAGDRFVFLGDFVDRGGDSAGVIARLIEIGRHHETVFIRGNHEEFMLEARSDMDMRRAWMRYGGVQTLDSYGEQAYPACVPEEHWRFLESTVNWHETDSHILVHAPISSDRPVAEQTSQEWRWAFDLPQSRHCSGKNVVCGHLPQRQGVPGILQGFTFIDTWACAGQWLTALYLETGDAFQGNELGETRVLSMKDFHELAP